ncbi:MAG: PIN domain-containing protein [Candidatus Iainarchaeum archaeon]|uniref:PIN domain-containing protein n=1 Tax=Candidatus Iainarchaeum sp. TaxID=3101447 RepID=A0A7T9I1Y4_9ARCH|nr:MAG: PIN domain-containing protein [Candidatus Diapherotrites archaeon]
MTATDVPFIDTNILVHAYRLDDKEKHTIAKRILAACFNGTRRLVISNQVLGEFVRVMSHKVENPLPLEEIRRIVAEILISPNWKKIDYTTDTIERALSLQKKAYSWDLVIAQTMQENGFTLIYTENTKDFASIPGIKTLNPFA